MKFRCKRCDTLVSADSMEDILKKNKLCREHREEYRKSSHKTVVDYVNACIRRDAAIKENKHKVPQTFDQLKRVKRKKYKKEPTYSKGLWRW